MQKVLKAYKYAIAGLILLSIGALGLLSSFAPDVVGYAIDVPGIGMASMSSLTLGLASLLIATNRLRNHISESDYVVSYYISVAKDRQAVQSVLQKVSTKQAVSGLVNVLLKSIVERDKRKLYMIADMEDLIKSKLESEKDPRELSACVELLGEAIDLCEKSKKIPGEVVMTLRGLYSLSKYRTMKLYAK